MNPPGSRPVIELTLGRPRETAPLATAGTIRLEPEACGGDTHRLKAGKYPGYI